MPATATELLILLQSPSLVVTSVLLVFVVSFAGMSCFLRVFFVSSACLCCRLIVVLLVPATATELLILLQSPSLVVASVLLVFVVGFAGMSCFLRVFLSCRLVCVVG